ncbi:hypothetical protein NQ318_003472 [Aromia moschata]|uniref:Uncharacterized protein n=1 Tax=Aromia moschata TaxID=1265417 RepID=A0AAV8YUC4_9CUCU|nr:hypothetical protein NQ318_003472 [Aromia moschata]
MPNKGVPSDFHVIRLGKLHQLIGLCVIKLSLGRFGGIDLHLIFGCQEIKLCSSQRLVCGIAELSAFVNKVVLHYTNMEFGIIGREEKKNSILLSKVGTMTILPPIRKTTGNAEENKESNQQNGPPERTNRRNDINSIQIASLSENNASARRSPFPFKSDRKERLRKRYKEADRPRDRESVREQKREVRREQKRDRIVINKREIISEPLHENNTITSPVDNPDTEPPCNNNKR